MWSFVSGFFHLALCSQGSSIIEQQSVLDLTAIMNECTLFTYSLDVGHWVVSNFLLL
jgi:hypothetical protein